MYKLFTISLLFCLVSCQSINLIDDCAGWSVIRPREKDIEIISIELAQQILAHNEYGKVVCGWKN